jgi:inorganic triphosphatase YgiF
LFQQAVRIRQEADKIRAEIQTLKAASKASSGSWRADRFFTLWNETVPEMEQW